MVTRKYQLARNFLLSKRIPDSCPLVVKTGFFKCICSTAMKIRYILVASFCQQDPRASSLSLSLLAMTTTPPAIIVGNALLQGHVAANDEWRQYGERRRQELLENDKEGRCFEMNRRVNVHRYFQVGDRYGALCMLLTMTTVHRTSTDFLSII